MDSLSLDHLGSPGSAGAPPNTQGWFGVCWGHKDGGAMTCAIAGSTEFAKKLGILIDKNKIIVNENMETNIKGIYACGDCTGGLFQISKAVYEGTKAGLQAIKYYKEMSSIK